MKKTALFCCEASINIGTGHVMRSLVIANKLHNIGWECLFVSKKESYDLIDKLSNFKRIEPNYLWKNPINCDLLIIDNYDLDENYENHFRNYAKKILVIDDLANRKHNCDILLDQNLGTKEENYENLVNKACNILTGTKYCLIRPEFADLREKSLKKRNNTTKINKILVNFGGSDAKNHSENALKMIEETNFNGIIDVVLGFNPIHFDKINNFAKNAKNTINIHKQSNMAQMIYDADLAIAAGGSSSWERCCLGLPTYMIKIADNQDKIFKELGTTKKFNEFFDEIKNNYQEHSYRISKLVDGIGIKRIISHI